MKKLRIAQLVLPWIAVPPVGAAGTERIVSSLTEGLVKKGHDVTLFSVGESQTAAKLSYVLEKAGGLQEDVMKTLKSSFYPLLHVASCFEKQNDFDIIHSHAQFLALPFAAIAKTPTIHTFHRTFQFDKPDETDLVTHYGYLPFTSISNAQRVAGINYKKTIYNGVDIHLFTFMEQNEREYLLWVGRIADKKGPLEAIHVAKKTGKKLLLVGKITEEEFFETEIKPHIDDEQIIYLGELSSEQLRPYYQKASAFLMPIKWNEPFGLVAAEAMSCGTPVIAYANGALPEIVIDGKTGFLVQEKENESDIYSIKRAGIEGLMHAVEHIYSLSDSEYIQMRKDSREHVEKHFSIEKMIDTYEALYEDIIGNT